MSIGMAGYLAVLSVQDIRHKNISLWLVMVAAGAGLVYALMSGHGWNILWDVLPGGVMCLIAVFASGVLGMGDGLIGLIYGLFFGWRSTCIWLMFGFLLAAMVGIGMCIRGKNHSVQIPLIPFLTIVHIGMSL